MDPGSAFTLFLDIAMVMFSIPGNTLIIFVCYSHLRKTTTDLMIGFQAIVDLLAAIPSFYTVVMIARPDFVDRTFCQVRAFSLFYVRYTSVFMMAAIALDRFRVVCRALDQRWAWKFRHIHGIILFCNVLGIGLSVPAVMVFVPRTLQIGVRCVRAVSLLPYFDESYQIILTLVFFLSLLLSSALYFNIYRVILNQNKVRAAMKQAPQQNMASTLATETSFSVPGPDKGEVNTVPETKSGKSADNRTKELVPTLSHIVCRKDGAHDENGIEDGEPGPSSDENERPASAHQQVMTETFRDHPNVPTEQGRIDMKPPKTPGVPPKTAEEAPSQTSKKQVRSNGRKERQTTAMLLVITVIFFVSWFPGVVFAHIPSHIIAGLGDSAVVNVLIVIYSLRSINHVVNVFVYTLMNRRFKERSKHIVKKMLGRK